MGVGYERFVKEYTTDNGLEIEISSTEYFNIDGSTREWEYQFNIGDGKHGYFLAREDLKKVIKWMGDVGWLNKKEV